MGIPFRFIQCGDLHLGAPFKYLKSLGRQMDEMLMQATYRAFENIIQLALAERVDAVLITGDIYNSEDHNLEAQIRFVRQMERLQEKAIPVFILQGNHDPVESWQAKLTLPENVRVFSAERVERYPLLVRGLEAASIYGRSCSRLTQYDNLTGGYKRQAEDVFALAMLHGTVGSSMPKGEVTGPCTKEDLQEAHMDYWALGHIHKRDVLDTAPYMVYAGNSQGLHRKELGAKGCYLVQVSANGHVELQFKDTCAVYFTQATIDISSLRSGAELEEMLRHKKEMLRNKYKKPVLVEFIFTGRGTLHKLCAQEEVREVWLKTSQNEEQSRAYMIFPYSLINQTKPELDLQARRQLPDMAGDYLAAYDALVQGEKPERLAKIRAFLQNRPESKRLGLYETCFTDELLERALQRAEVEGVLRLVGEEHED